MELRRGALSLLYRSRNVYEKGIAAEDAADVDALPEPPAIADISWKAWQLTQVDGAVSGQSGLGRTSVGRDGNEWGLLVLMLRPAWTTSTATLAMRLQRFLECPFGSCCLSLAAVMSRVC